MPPRTFRHPRSALTPRASPRRTRLVSGRWACDSSLCCRERRSYKCAWIYARLRRPPFVGSPGDWITRSACSPGTETVAATSAPSTVRAISRCNPGRTLSNTNRPRASVDVQDQRLAVFGLRLRWLARVRQQGAVVEVAVRRTWLRKPVTAGLSSASFCRIASALRDSASASAGLPVPDSRTPSCCGTAPGVAEVGDGGVVVGQLLPDRHRLAVLGLRLRGLPVFDSRLPSRYCGYSPAIVAEFGDGRGCRRPASARSPAPCGTRPPPPPACPPRTAGCRGCCGRPPGCCGIR